MTLVAKDISEADFLFLSPETNALEAARAMKEKRHGFVVIKGRMDEPSGIVTEWDYLSKIIAEGRDPSKMQLSEIMTPNVVTVKMNEDVIIVAKLMHEKGIRRVLVLDGKKVVGVITSKTVLASLEDYLNRLSAQIARLHTPIF
ncbi:MAG: CBS domain-containing protein [Nitrososphaerales archaeon]